MKRRSQESQDYRSQEADDMPRSQKSQESQRSQRSQKAAEGNETNEANKQLKSMKPKQPKKPLKPTKPRSQEVKKPRRPEAKKTRSQEAKKPRSQEAKKPRRQEDKKPRRQEDKKTRKPATNRSQWEAHQKQEKNKKNCDKIIPNTSQPFAGLFLRWARVPEILPWGHFTWKVAGSLFMSRPDKICKTHECIIPLRKACRQQKGVEENWSTIWTAIRTQWGFVAPNIETPSLPGTAHHVRLDARSSC